MFASDIILAVRQRLNDIKHPYRWSDEALLDDINGALSAIVDDVNPWNDGEWSIKLIDGKGRYELPPYFHRLKLVKINGTKIPVEQILGYEQFLDQDSFCSLAVSTSLNNFHIYPTTFKAQEEVERTPTTLYKEEVFESDIAVLYYDRREQIAYVSDKINLPENFRMAIVFHVLHLTNQSPVVTKGDTKSVTFLTLYDKQIEKLKAQLFSNKHTRRIRSRHIRV